MKQLSSHFLLAIALICACSPQGPQVAGTSEQGNAKITATLYTEGGLPAAGLAVRLRRQDYVTDPAAALKKKQSDSTQTATDGKGFFSIDSLDTGAYSVEATDGKAYAVLLKFAVGPKREPISWGSDTIRPFAAVKGAVDTARSQAKRFVQVYGLERLDSVASNGAFTVGDLPQGVYTVRIIAVDSSAGLPVFDSVSAKAGAITTISPYEAWKNHASIYINTSATGAGVGENALGFPILIRLTSGNFNFSEAQADGRDLRFSKLDGMPLHFELERWDPAAGAAIWVKVDTVFGNDSGQSITMYWNNPAALAQSDGAKVFDTADGFQGVWHLGDESDTIRDATGNKFHGFRHGNLTPSTCEIGYGQLFGKSGAYCEMGNVFNPGMSGFTASAWVKRADTSIQTVIAKSNGGTPSSAYGWNLSFGLSNEIHCYLATGGSAWGSTGAFDFKSNTDAAVIDTTQWHFLVAVVDRSNPADCRTYIDGADVTDGGSGDLAAVGSLVNSLPLRIGAEADGDFKWTGSIDECVVSRTARSAAWVRLCYSNQGPIDRLVKIKGAAY